MTDTIDYTEVPYLQEILNFLPIDPVGEEEVLNYIQNVTDLIAVNYKYSQYQFSYFGIHLLYMTYIYCTAWKISQIDPLRYKDAIAFVRPYNGRERDLKIEEAVSVFNYSLIPESDIAKLFRIIDLDKAQISNVSVLVNSRNIMAHASGKFEILNEDGFNVKVSSVLLSMKCIHKSFDKWIRRWYSAILLRYCAGEYKIYRDLKDIIEEQMIQNFKLSTNELLICNEMSVRTLVTTYRGQKGYEYRLKKFKKAVKEYCQNMGYI